MHAGDVRAPLISNSGISFLEKPLTLSDLWFFGLHTDDGGTYFPSSVKGPQQNWRKFQNQQTLSSSWSCTKKSREFVGAEKAQYVCHSLLVSPDRVIEYWKLK